MDGARILLLLMLLPLLILMLLNWSGARRTMTEIWAFGQLSFDEISQRAPC
jgi:hypothetical protein